MVFSQWPPKSNIRSLRCVSCFCAVSRSTCSWEFGKKPVGLNLKYRRSLKNARMTADSWSPDGLSGKQNSVMVARSIHSCSVFSISHKSFISTWPIRALRLLANSFKVTTVLSRPWERSRRALSRCSSRLAERFTSRLFSVNSLKRCFFISKTTAHVIFWRSIYSTTLPASIIF